MKKFLEFIPQRARVYIYGAGVTGKKIFNSITDNRTDIQIQGFLDTFKSGEFLGKEVINVASLVNKNDGSIVLLASVDDTTLAEMSKNITGKHFEVLCPFKLEDEIFSEAEINKLNGISKNLQFGREAFELLIQARIKNDYKAVKSYYDGNIVGKKTQYFSGPPIKKKDIVLDGGMFDGKEAMMFADVASEGFVFSFDPWGGKLISDRELFDSYDNIEIVKKAMWDKTAKVYFSANTPSGYEAGAFVSPEQDGNLEPVEACSIDDFIIEKKLNRVDLIKMDIEGSEIAALKGAEKTISKIKPNLAICVYHDAKHFYEIPEMILRFNSSYKIGFEHYTDNLTESVMYFF